MTDTKKGFLFRPIIIYLILSFSMIAILPSRSIAAFIPSATSQGLSSSKSVRNTDIEKIQQVLEAKVISQRLADLGLDDGEIKDRLDRLTDEEVHQFATQLESLQAGGEVTSLIISLLLIVILVLVVLHLTGHKIIVE